MFTTDGDSLHEGGCPLHPTPVALQQSRVKALTTPIGKSIKFLGNDIDKGEALVEAPALRKREDRQVCGLGEQLVQGDEHSNVAISESLAGHNVRAPEVLFETEFRGLIRPGSVGLYASGFY